jgi:uncharacterized membrane protein YphA (DoxX/SURF4 family)
MLRMMKLRPWLSIPIACVWIFHGLVSKILMGIPRHQAIVGRILGESYGAFMTNVIGVLEILLGLWILSGYKKKICATLQTLALVVMNALEIKLAKDLLYSPWGMIILNLGFIAIIWIWASQGEKRGLGGDHAS